MVSLRRSATTFMIVACATLPIAACGDDEESGAAGGGGGGDPYVIGYQAPLSGQLSFLGTGDLAGLQTYFDKVNDEGGINGREVEVVSKDDKGAVDTGVTVFRDLARQEAVTVAGFPISTVAEAVFRNAEAQKVPMIGYGITTDAMLTPASPWSYSTGATARTYVSVMAEYVRQNAPERGIDTPKVAILAVDTTASKQVRDLVRDASGEAGWEMTASEFIPLTASDAGAQVNRIAAGDPDYVFLWLTPPLLPMVATAAKANGLATEDVHIVGAYFANDEKVIAELDLPNYYYQQVNLWPTNPDEAAVKPVQEAAAKFGREDAVGTPHFVDGWVTASLIAKALEGCDDPCTGEKMSTLLAQADVGDAEGLGGPRIGFMADDHEAYAFHRVVHFDPAKGYTVPATDWLEWKTFAIG